MKTKILLLAMSFALPLFTMANNIRVILNSYNPTTKQLKISLAWDNSWHDGSGQFRDAAWLFVKYKDITNSEWQHAIIANPTSANNILTDTLSGSGVKFDVIGKNPSVAPGPTGSRGYIIRRQKGATAALQNNPEYAGVYNVGLPLTITLALPSGVTLANPEFRVYALEMVDIPTGSFYAGDGSANSIVKNSATNNGPFLLTSETAAISPNILGNTLTLPAVTSTAPSFPRGVNEFFQMKYELSSEGFVEFLNTLNRTQQNFFGNNSVNPLVAASSGSFTMDFYRGFEISANVTSTFDPVTFISSKPFKAMRTYLQSYTLAYLDWAALRPMSALEYEKACRGPLQPVINEFAWGTSNSTEIYTNPDIDLNGINESYSVNVNGPFALTTDPVRCGAFAKASGSNRLNSGGTYYGAMEMSGNANEFVLVDQTFLGQNGDGKISITGEHNTNGWGSTIHVKTTTVSTTGYNQNSNGNTLNTSDNSVGIRGIIK